MNLSWSDIQSETMNAEDYLNFIKEKEAYSNYKNYKVNQNKIAKIIEILKEKNDKIKIFAIGASWCPDCSKQIPAMIKIAENVNDGVDEVKILYGVKTNPFHKKGEPLWHEKHSPPEATDPKFDVKKIPTIFFFNKNGKCLGRIVEKPKEGHSLEDEIIEIFKN